MFFYRLGNFFEKLGELPKNAKAYFAHRRRIIDKYENLQPYDQALKDEYDRIMKAESDHRLDAVPRSIVMSVIGVVVILIVWLIDVLVFHTKVSALFVLLMIAILLVTAISAMLRLMKVIDEADIAATDIQREARDKHYNDYLSRKQRIGPDGKPVGAPPRRPAAPAQPPKKPQTATPRYTRRR